MISLIYGSTATYHMTEEELIEILRQAESNNSELGITGMLLYKDGNFLQVLEGEEDVVMPLYNKIKFDERHHQVITIGKRKITERDFEKWSMGFVNISNLTPENLPGYSDYLNEPLNADRFAENPAFAHRFLRVFKEATI